LIYWRIVWHAVAFLSGHDIDRFEGGSMNYAEMRLKILDVARQCYAEGQGWAQETVVLREFAKQYGVAGDESAEQAALTCWHDLFRDGELSWGYNIDNPGSPWFHFPRRDVKARILS
jgi:hypothetical protein